MIDLLIEVLDPNKVWLIDLDTSSVVFQRLVETSSAFIVVLAILLIIGIYKVLTAFCR